MREVSFKREISLEHTKHDIILKVHVDLLSWWNKVRQDYNLESLVTLDRTYRADHFPVTK